MAQTNNFLLGYSLNSWPSSRGLYFDSADFPHTFIYNIRQTPYMVNNFCYSANWQGKPWFYYNGNNFQDINGRILSNSNLFNDKNVSRFDNEITTTYDTGNFIFLRAHQWKAINDGSNITGEEMDTADLIYTLIRPKDDLLEIKPNENNVVMPLDKAIRGIGATRDNSGQPCFVVSVRDMFYSVKLDPTGNLRILDSFYHQTYPGMPNLYANLPFVTNFSDHVSLKMNHAGTKFYFYILNKTTSWGRVVSETSIIYSLDFNGNTGKISNLQEVYAHKWDINNQLAPRKHFKWIYLNISLNDRFLYGFGRQFTYTDDLYQIVNANSISYSDYNGEKLFQIDLNGVDKSPKVLHDYPSINNVGSYASHSSYFSPSLNNKFYIIDTINNVVKVLNNLDLPLGGGVSTIVLPDTIANSQFEVWSDNKVIDFTRLKQSVIYGCKAQVSLSNQSLPQINFGEYKWHIQNENNTLDVYTTKNPPLLTYSKNGDYVIKLLSRSATGNNYAEWYIDTIKVRIPTPPTANFRSNNPICLFTPLAFENQSNQGQVNPNTGVSYLWSFGDGKTSTAAFPSHSYTQAGVYDAQLIVNNGYCADTLLKKQYIRAVDAPQPGMVLNATAACTPFNLTITEINTRPVIKRTYLMGDGQTQNPAGNGFSYLYNQPGTYQIIQILESTSGCVSRDTIMLRLRKGFEPTDSAKMVNGTYLNNETIALQWQPLKDAAGYQIYGSPAQNGVYNKIKELPGNTTQTTIEGFTPKVQFFGVTGIDSCGNYSAMGNISAPIFLQHTQNGNTSVALNYTAYLDWQVPVSSYEIEYTYGADTQLLVSQNMAKNYTDYNFAQTESTLKCYRVTAYSTDGRKTQSNIVCAGMVPIVFIPNAFTPNKDGLNDVFTPNTIGVESYEMQIFTRWGELVSKTENSGWVAGNAPEGVYKVLFYGKSATGERINIMSNVLLLK